MIWNWKTNIKVKRAMFFCYFVICGFFWGGGGLKQLQIDAT